MKVIKSIFLFLFALSLGALEMYGQEMKGENLVCSQVIEFPEMSQSQIFAKSKEWLAYYYKNSLFTIQVDDPENGKLISKGNYKDFHIANYKGGIMPYTLKLTMDHVITIRCKDNKAQITIESGEIRANCNGYDWEHKFPMLELNPVSNFKGAVPKRTIEKGLSGAFESATKIMNFSISDFEAYVKQVEDDF